MMRQMRFVVCYDICGDGFEKRLRKVYTTLRAYGEHLQYSVFRCELNDLQLARLESELGDVIDVRKDQVLFVPLGVVGRKSAWAIRALGVPIDDPERVVRIV